MNSTLSAIAVAALAITLALPASVATHASGHIATCSIAVASPHTRTAVGTLHERGTPGVDACEYSMVGRVGRTMTTVTTSTTAVPIDVDIHFLNAMGNRILGCTSAAPDESCLVPAGATKAIITANSGALLSVAVYITPP